MSSYPHNPPFAADEVTMLRSWIDYYRDTIRTQTAGLDAAQLAATIPGHPAVMTLGGMVKHLAFVEQWWFTIALHGRPPVGFWADVDWDADEDWDWSSARHDSPEELRAMYDAEVARSDAALDEALAAGGLDQPGKRARSDGSVATLDLGAHGRGVRPARRARGPDPRVRGRRGRPLRHPRVRAGQVRSWCRHRTLPSGSLNHAAFSSPNSQTWSTVFSSGRS